MTNADRSQEERRLDDERCVDGLLAEAGFPDDAELRALLLEMRKLRVTEVPQPSAELAALMGQPDTAEVIRLEEWSRRHPRKKRAVFTTLAVAASLGIAGGAAAGNDSLRSQAEGTISSILSSFSNHAPTTPAPSSPPRAPEPVPAIVPPSDGGPPVGTAPAPAPVQGAEPSVGERRENSDAPRHMRSSWPRTLKLRLLLPEFRRPEEHRPSQAPPARLTLHHRRTNRRRAERRRPTAGVQTAWQATAAEAGRMPASQNRLQPKATSDRFSVPKWLRLQLAVGLPSGGVCDALAAS